MKLRDCMIDPTGWSSSVRSAMWAAVRREALQVREAREVEGRESIRGDVRVGFGVLGKFEAKSHFYFRPALQTSSLQTTASEHFTFVAEDTDKIILRCQVSINPRIPLLCPPSHSSKDETI